MMREIVLDTETTGVDAAGGDRVVEIGCVELVNHMPTGRFYHCYLNPDRAMSEGAFRVHGLSDEFLSDKPRFADVADEFCAFIEDSRLVIHNAAFDIAFLNAELARIQRRPLDTAMVVDTLMLARRKHPGAANSLDALCQRYGIDNSKRTKHGALLDAEILAEVYLELVGGRQTGLALITGAPLPSGGAGSGPRQRPQPLPPRLTDMEKAAHAAFVETLGPDAIWRDYIGTGEETRAAS